MLKQIADTEEKRKMRSIIPVPSGYCEIEEAEERVDCVSITFPPVLPIVIQSMGRGKRMGARLHCGWGSPGPVF